MTAKISNLLKIKKSSAFVNELKTGHYYIFTGKPSIWSANEDDPDFSIPVPLMDENTLKTELRELIGLKKITSDQVSLAIRRYDWSYGSIYDKYDAYDENLLIKYFQTRSRPFYVMTDEYQVYKCLNNNFGAYSTVKPSNTSLLPFTTGDGYLWKYMFTVSEEQILNFLTPDFIPIKSNEDLILNSSQYLIKQAAIPGTIDVVDITESGSGYVVDETSLLVASGSYSFAETGSGFDAQVSVDYNTGEVTNISVINPGSHYSSDTVSLISGDGSNASVTLQVSPFEGHGSNAAYELGAFYVLISVSLLTTGNDLAFFPLTQTYRKVGIITDFSEYNSENQYSKEYYYGPSHESFLDESLRLSTPDQLMVEDKGTIIYLNNIAKVTRVSNQRETIKLSLTTF